MRSGAVRQIVMDAATDLGDDVVAALEAAKKVEKSPVGLDILNQITDNAKIARDEKAPMCQDTGYAVMFVELGQDVHITGGDFEEAINEGVRRGYKDGYLRKSVLGDPIERKNTGDNTPAIIHTQIVPGDKMKITIAPKGGGSENMSEVKMMKLRWQSLSAGHYRRWYRRHLREMRYAGQEVASSRSRRSAPE